MKILRSKGLSYTEGGGLEGREDRLARGLLLKGENLLTPSGFRGDLKVAPVKLSDFVGEDYALILRQTISVLDKVIRKPGSLRKCALQTYIDRTLLAAQLWQRLLEKCEGGILSLPGGKKAFEQFKANWHWKVHPYARKECKFSAPQTDLNAKFIVDFGDPTITREDAQGRWHGVFWKQAGAKPDYAAIADAILDHLFVQERTIKGDIRTKLDENTGAIKATGCGLVAARGNSIAKSINDPRRRRDEKKQLPRNKNVRQEYFETDIAARIFEMVSGDTNQKVSFDSRKVGARLYDHFKPLLDRYGNMDTDQETGSRRELWKLHNKVRQYYQKVLRGERFRRAFKEAHDGADGVNASKDILKKVLPENGTQLCNILEAKERNIDISKLIRLGKMVVHASNLPVNADDPQGDFDKRMDYFATSEGQSEIKRNETFTRVWRISVAMSLRTLKAWADPKNEIRVQTKQGFENDDIASAKVAAVMCGEKFNLNQFDQHLPLVFGDKVIADQKSSRASIFAQLDVNDKKKMLWAFLRLAGQLRNQCNHFNTKDQLVHLLSQGILSEMTEYKPVDKFRKLLTFDRRLQRNVLLDDLNRLEIRRYVAREHFDALVAQLRPATGHELMLPKFMSVVRRAYEVGQPVKDKNGKMTEPVKHLAGFANLDLKNIAMTKRGVNHFKIGILRMLYGAGFQAWLNRRQEKDPSFVRNAIKSVLDEQHKRTARAKEKAFYAVTESILDEMQLESATSLNELFGKLLARSSSQERENQAYRANKTVQKERIDILNRFKLDLFGSLFARYLQGQDDGPDLGWIWQAKDLLAETEKPQPVVLEDIGQSTETDDEAWMAQFYAWLYLVPSDDIALLRYQFRKTLVLEGKSAGETPPEFNALLDKIDGLMGLYTAVQSAGFSGTEHVARLKANTAFYEDADQFAKIYSEENETHHMSFPGTRRGLRQILRFGDQEVLKKIFERHKITREEVDAFSSLVRGDTKSLFEQRNDLREQIFKSVDAQKIETPKFVELCESYRKLVTRTTLYQFQAAGARLTEHARLHHLLLKIIGRLTDFTLTWERDQHCLMLGMLYWQAVDRKEEFRIDVQKNRIGLVLDDEKYVIFRDRVKHDEERFKSKLKPQEREDIENGFVPLWGEGFVLKFHYQLQSLLEPEYQAQFSRYFGKLSAENPKDVAADKRRKKDGQMQRNTSKPQANRESWQSLKGQIRNDFAHFNVLSTKRAFLNLNYAVNAVRSLLSYDRKLKNAVPRAIKDIVADEGLVLDWQLHEDRLRHARIYPNCEKHLAAVKAGENVDVTFMIPQASVRYTSMVKALFEFDPGGYREMGKVGGKPKRNGRLQYPDALWQQHGEAIPDGIRNLEYVKSGSD
ncbi:type VI-A CRISPR-associated RNA-guided ribonuclease Cas13a [Thalassospira sp.]|uniref:type VI-A CRISPR-associated RNA-guided ribonuclease Cas13a n=1 Tax=Thalassospira sp. TaxID=1912094 RepID=UPI003AA90542